MNTAPTSLAPGDPARILDRHAIRRTAGVPTVSLLVGPIGVGCATWRRWASTTGRKVIVANRNLFPMDQWVRCVAEQVDLPAAAIRCLAQRAGRDPDEFLAACFIGHRLNAVCREIQIMEWSDPTYFPSFTLTW